ncbi:hypothetical protein HDV05_002015 [Chytridiales sp. JEL 0842]|nr:hypothetical protein HDV05_002015 [Chytridiales sp. JEL 0842]
MIINRHSKSNNAIMKAALTLFALLSLLSSTAIAQPPPGTIIRPSPQPSQGTPTAAPSGGTGTGGGNSTQPTGGIIRPSNIPGLPNGGLGNGTCDPALGCTDTTGVDCIESTGGSPGSFILRNPIGSTVAPIGNILMINWTYTSVDTSRFPNSSIAIYYALFAASTSSTPGTVKPDTWYSFPIATNIPTNALSYEWRVPQLQPGQYKLRIVGDSLDPALSQSRGQSVCIRDSQPLPFTSAGFFIVGSSQLVSFPDTFGPSSGSLKSISNLLSLLGLGVSLVLALVA